MNIKSFAVYDNSMNIDCSTCVHQSVLEDTDLGLMTSNDEVTPPYVRKQYGGAVTLGSKTPMPSYE